MCYGVHGIEFNIHDLFTRTRNMYIDIQINDCFILSVSKLTVLKLDVVVFCVWLKKVNLLVQFRNSKCKMSINDNFCFHRSIVTNGAQNEEMGCRIKLELMFGVYDVYDLIRRYIIIVSIIMTNSQPLCYYDQLRQLPCLNLSSLFFSHSLYSFSSPMNFVLNLN